MIDKTEASEAEVATDLVKRIASGDSAAEGEFVERYSNGLLFMLRRMTRDPALADDLHQEAFRVVLGRLRTKALEQPERLAGFLRSTARNLLVAERRKTARRRTDGDLEEVERFSDSEPGQLSRTLKEEEYRLVRRLLDELEPDRDRQILYRFYIAEEAKERICDDLGLTRLHFNRVIFRARQRFKDLFESYHKRQRLERAV